MAGVYTFSTPISQNFSLVDVKITGVYLNVLTGEIVASYDGRTASAVTKRDDQTVLSGADIDATLQANIVTILNDIVAKVAAKEGFPSGAVG